MNLISILLGVAAFIFALIVFFPLLGSLNWIALPVEHIGLVIGTLSENKVAEIFIL